MIYLHIGRHKTGTTAIQGFLSANRDRLAAAGFTYPPTSGTEDAHHGVWMALRQRAGAVRAPLSSPGITPTDLDELSQLLRSAPNAVVSSEAFQNLNPADFVDVFPPGQTTVVVYLREQLDYLLSAYSQEIQSELELRSLDEFIRSTPVRYGPFLDAWARVFGRDHLIVKLYDRAQLKHGDVVDDFMDTLGVRDLDTFERPDDNSLSVSLPALLVTTKRLLNRVLTPEQHREWRLYGRFGQLASHCPPSARVGLDKRASAALRDEYRADNAYVSQQYFDSSEDVFRYVPVPEVVPPTISEVRTMLNALDELAPDAHRLLLETVENDDLVQELPEDERTLAKMIVVLAPPNAKPQAAEAEAESVGVQLEEARTEREAPSVSARRWRAFAQLVSWLARGRLRDVRRYFALRRSFDYAAYLAANRDVAAAGLHPLLHYIKHGGREGRALGPPPREAETPQSPADALPGPTGKPKVLLVGHDAHQHGAQMIILNVAETLKNQFGCEVACLLLRDGALVPKYGELGRVYVANDDPAEMQAAIAQLRQDGFELALTNTVVSGSSVPLLKAAGFRVVSLIHELPGIIGEMGIEARLAAILEESDTIVAPAKKVADSLERTDSFAGHDRVVVRPQGLYKELEPPPDAYARLRRDLSLDDNSRIVLNVGFGDLRKGVDTFVRVAKVAASHTDDMHFVWVGRIHPDAERLFADEIGDRFHLVPFTDDLAEFYFGADAFFLSSREDPFPSVVLEAMVAGLPVVGFTGASGSEELIAQHGRLVDPDDLAGVVTALDEVTRDDNERARQARASVVAEQFRYDDYCFDLLRLLDPDLEKVSVVVPNYNYARHLEGRMRSIFDQTYPVFETIVLDDCSTDDSLARLDDIALTTGRRFRVVANDENSGSPFAQWERGSRLARGTYVWVAEADDGSGPRFLEEVVSHARREGASFAFSDSVPIDEDGVQLAESYKEYYRESVGNLMDESFDLDGKTFVEQCLAERNLMLNASAVVWDRAALIDALDECLGVLKEYRLTGDWHLYAAAALQAPRVAYLSSPLNVHRRHHSSVTASLDAHRHVEEIERVQAFVAEKLGLDDTARRRMRAYADVLRRQFGIATQETPADEDSALVRNADAP